MVCLRFQRKINNFAVNNIVVVVNLLCVVFTFFCKMLYRSDFVIRGTIFVSGNERARGRYNIRFWNFVQIAEKGLILGFFWPKQGGWYNILQNFATWIKPVQYFAKICSARFAPVYPITIFKHNRCAHTFLARAFFSKSY